MMKKKRWVKLGLVAVALLLIPRRSSKQSQIVSEMKANDSETTTKPANNASEHPE